MALGVSLQSDLETWFATGSATLVGAGVGWADVIQDYFIAVFPACTTVITAAASLATDLDAAFAGSDPGADMDQSFQSFGTAVGIGMGPAFVATPPPGVVGFETATAAAHPLTHAAAAAIYAVLIDTWTRTGSAVPLGGGATVPWS